MLEEVGEENVVVVVTHNASNYMKVGKNIKILRIHSLSIFLMFYVPFLISYF